MVYRGMRVVITENRDKAARIVNGQDATVLYNQNNTIILQLPEGDKVFVYPVTHKCGDEMVTTYPFTPAYARTICKSQGQNIKGLLVLLDSALVPPGMVFVTLSHVRRKSEISLQPLIVNQLEPIKF